MFCVNNQSDSQKSSASFGCEFDGPQGSLMNRSKRAHSDSGQKSRFVTTGQQMQANVHKMDATSRYDSVSSHGGQSSSAFRNNGSLSGSESVRILNSSYSSTDKAKNMNYGCENVADSPYAGWQGLNTSSSSSNGWNIPDGKAAIGRHNREGSSGNPEESMSIDNEVAFSGLLGATGGAENYSEEKSNVSNNFAGNSSRSMHMPRMGLLGGGESSITSQSSGWNGSQGPTMAVSGWVGANRQNSSSEMTGNSNSENMMVDNDMGFTGILGATGGADFSDKPNPGNTYRQDHPRIGLLGGGESSINGSPNGWANSNNSGNSSSGWGTSVRTSTGNPTDIATGTGTSPTKPQGSWAQAAGKGLNPTLPPCTNSNGNNGNAQNATPPTMTENSSQENTNAPRDRVEEQAKEIRLKAAFSEGWGQNSVNQDTPWDVPLSPTPENNLGKENPAVWRAPVNNGTEVWENNLRMTKGAPTAAPVAAVSTPPWGHTPSTNIGGHWGDDDSSNNMWSGVPQGTNANPANWPETNAPANNSMWGNAIPNEKHWSGNQQASWNEGPGPDNGTSVWNSNNVNKGRPVGNWSPMATPKKEMPPSGWEPPSPPPGRRPPPSGNYDDGTAVWGNPQRQGKVSHWKDMPAAKPIMNSGNNMVSPNGMPLNNMNSGPGMIRIPGNNKNDVGNSVWSKQPQPLTRNSSWQDMPPHRDSPNIGNWGEENHLHNQMKNLPNQAYNGGWSDQSNNPLSYWGAKPKANSNWADGQVDTSSWLGPAKQGGKPLCRDLIWASKQFRLLIELGFKKEDAENALRNNNMSFDDALAELRAGMPLDNNMMDVDSFPGRKMRPANMSEDISMTDHGLDASFNPNFHGPNSFQAAMNFPGVQNFKQQVPKGPNGNNANLLNTALGGQQSSIGSIGSFAPAIVHKLLQQQQQQQPIQAFNPGNLPGNAFGNQNVRISQNTFPSAAQLRHLVQQIQMAVQAGHLNPQILNQPLAPQTLQLLYQLLQQIKMLSQLQQQQVYQSQHMAKPLPGVPNGSGGGLQLNVQLTQTKQRILNLQNQIAAQQAVFLKAQVPQPLAAQHSSQGGDIFKPNIEAMPALHNEFRDLSLKDVPHQNHQSRLNQWKLPSYDKEEPPMPGETNQAAIGISNDFSRAPGPLNSKPTASAPNSGSGFNPLLGQGESTWSTISSRSHGDSGWPEAASTPDNGNNNANSSTQSMINNGQTPGDKESTQTSSNQAAPPSTPHSAAYNLTDLVPEFEPGKPWKGTQIKSVEDDPHMTPGSITRSPLSVNTIKDSNLFWNSKTSPAITSGDTAGSLTSSTWVFNPPNTGPNSSSNGPAKLGGKPNWGSEIGPSSDLWGSSVAKPRGPPPGLAACQAVSWDRQNSSNFLILRNLTPQIDGSTLKTLCMQHGPLQIFHLLLNRGVALVRYSTREEASKAQSALNNCVLGNTTMLADFPSEGEIQQYLQVSSGQAGSNAWASSQPQQGSSSYHGTGASSYYGGSGSKIDTSSWNGNAPTSQLWSFSNSSLWSSSQPVNDHDPSTNPMNSYLPGDLLGGEPM